MITRIAGIPTVVEQGLEQRVFNLGSIVSGPKDIASQIGVGEPHQLARRAYNLSPEFSQGMVFAKDYDVFVLNGDKLFPAQECLDCNGSQYGFAGGVSKVLYSPKVKLVHFAPEYSSFFGFSPSKADTNAKFFGWLSDGSHDAEQVVKVYLGLDYSFLDIPEMFLLSMPGSSKSNKLLFEPGVHSDFLRKEVGAVCFDFDVAFAEADSFVMKVLSELGIAYHVPKIVSIPPRERVKRVRGGYAPNLEQIGCVDAWKKTYGQGVEVFVIDTGIAEHPEFENRLRKGKCFVGSTDDNGHGTHVAGTIGGASTGVSNCFLTPVKVLNAEGSGSEVDVIQGIQYAVEHGAEIISMSLGSSQRSLFEEKAVRYAFDRGVLVVAAAGNDGDSSYNYPASYDGVVSVAAVDGDNQHADFSNHNDMVDISAPGVDIVSCVPGGYAQMSGTSMATPHVSGVSALIKSLKSCSPKDLEDCLEAAAMHLGQASYFGAGLVRADTAVSGLNSAVSPLPLAVSHVSKVQCPRSNVQSPSFDVQHLISRGERLIEGGLQSLIREARELWNE